VFHNPVELGAGEGVSAGLGMAVDAAGGGTGVDVVVSAGVSDGAGGPILTGGPRGVGVSEGADALRGMGVSVGEVMEMGVGELDTTLFCTIVWGAEIGAERTLQGLGLAADVCGRLAG
jgi:hypothetical protein